VSLKASGQFDNFCKDYEDMKDIVFPTRKEVISLPLIALGKPPCLSFSSTPD
jgi:hypothetical protein